MVERATTDSMIEHMASIYGLSESTVTNLLQGDIALLAAKALLEQGDVREAARLFEVARHSVDTEKQRDLAVQFLALARAWTKLSGAPESNDEAERALRYATELAPLLGLPALAQYLQRQQRSDEAMNCWREAIRAAPQEANYYLNLARLYERCDQPGQALTTYLELIDAVPSAKNYLIVAQRLDDLAPGLPDTSPDQRVRIALLGNATLDHLQSYLKVECFRAGLRPEVYQTGFDQYTQDILNPHSQLYVFDPEIVICAIHASRLFPRIHGYTLDMSVEERQTDMDAGLRTLQSLLDQLTEHSTALILVHNMVVPQFPALGILDWRDELGQSEMFGRINSRIAALVRSRYKNVYVIDEDRVQARSGKATATDPRLWLTARMGWSEGVLSGLSKEYLRYLIPFKARNRKCIVLDLDNTLWGGVIGEDGMAGIQLGADAPGNAFMAFQQELERLWRRGILLAISSKNNEDDVRPMLEDHPHMVLKLSHFAAHRINWQAKAQNIREIAQELNIGLDSIVFLDDNPVERARVRADLPQVLVPELPTDPAYFRQTLLDLGVFETLALTEEDRRRNQIYAEQKARREFEVGVETGSGSLEEYLAALEMVVEIEPASEQTVPRIAQLTNKTNQFNLTTRRYGEARIVEMQSQGGQVYSVRVTDRFGDNGVVGVAILMPIDDETWELDTLLLSCRVMGRGVETALLSFLTDHARRSGIRRLQGWYVPTAKNSPVKSCYRDHGFTLVKRDHSDSELWQLDLLEHRIETPGWLTCRDSLSVS